MNSVELIVPMVWITSDSLLGGGAPAGGGRPTHRSRSEGQLRDAEVEPLAGVEHFRALQARAEPRHAIAHPCAPGEPGVAASGSPPCAAVLAAERARELGRGGRVEVKRGSTTNGSPNTARMRAVSWSRRPRWSAAAGSVRSSAP